VTDLIQHDSGDRCLNCNGSRTIIEDVFGIRAEVKCPTCKGTGKVNDPNACVKCMGSRKMISQMGGLNFEEDCDRCNGSSLEPPKVVS